MNYRFLGVGAPAVASSLRDFIEALRRLLFPRPIPVPVKKMLSSRMPLLGMLLGLTLLTSACTKKAEPAASSASASDTTTAQPAATKSGESAGGASPLGQQMMAQKIVEDISGGTDIRQGRKAAEKIRSVSETHNADLDEIQ